MSHSTAMSKIVSAQLAGVVGGAAVLWGGLSAWWALGTVLAVAVTLLLVRIGKLDWLDWIRVLCRFALDGRRGDRLVGRAPSSHRPLWWHGTEVVAVVEVLPPRGDITRITRDRVESDHRLPLGDIARCLVQHDIALSAIDVVSHGYRTIPGTPAAEVYDRLLGPLPAPAMRTAWLALRFDPNVCPEAVARRGGGAEGAARAMVIAARRVTRALAAAGYRSRILTAAEIQSATAHITRGVGPGELRQTWSQVPLPGACNVGYALDPRQLTREHLTQVWAPSTLGTTVTVRLRPGAEPGSVRAGAAFRLTTRTLPERKPLPGLVSTRGRGRESLLAHLPLAVPGLESLMPLRTFGPDDLDALHLPVTGCGQLVGSDSSGQAVGTRLLGAGVDRVYVAGELYLAQQLVFRAVATGARLVIHTDRAHAWRSLIDAVATPDRLRIAGASPQTDSEFDAVVLDGVQPPTPRPGVTAIHLYGQPEQWPQDQPDLSILQPGAIGDQVVLTIGGRGLRLSLVTIPSEAAFIGRPRSSPALAPTR